MKRKVTLKQRLKEPTPRFFKKVIAYGVSVGVIGAAIATAPMTCGLTLPAAVLTVAKIMVTAGGVATAIGKMTSANENTIQ